MECELDDDSRCVQQCEGIRQQLGGQAQAVIDCVLNSRCNRIQACIQDLDISDPSEAAAPAVGSSTPRATSPAPADGI
ncbi:MAG: hypothetical protein R3F60_29065 [bacterium]